MRTGTRMALALVALASLGAGPAGAENKPMTIATPEYLYVPGYTVEIRAPGGPYYVSAPIVLQRGSGLTLLNADTGAHDIRDIGCGVLAPLGDCLFASPLIGLLQQADVQGVEALPAGSYRFYCTIHETNGMIGELVVVG